MTSGKTENKTLVANMQHVKWKAIPPIKGPDPQGLNIKSKQVKTIINSGDINGRQNRQVLDARSKRLG